MSAILIQIESSPSNAADNCARSIAKCLGVKVVVVADYAGALEEIHSTRLLDGLRIGFMVCTSSICSLNASDNPDCLRQLSELRKVGDWLIYSFGDGLSGENELPSFFGGLSFPSTTLIEAQLHRYRFETSGRWKSPLAGLSFECREQKPIYCFASSDESKHWSSIIWLNELPLVVTRTRGLHVDYLFSGTPNVDLNTFLEPPHVSREYLPGILPVALVLREMFGESCWHNPFPSGSVVIDDPLIRRQYGGFNYGNLDREMRDHGYAATIAFIPCNYRRSDKELARELRENPKRFSICVHGCYHTKSEYGESDAGSIENTSRTALRFMELHRDITGLSFEKTMVFPQGVFSSTAMSALKNCGYMAAVNSEPYPTDFRVFPGTIGDLFDLAILRYSQFPLFTRRYPHDVFEFAADLFFGKPAIIVEHHEYFRNGASPLSDFIGEINALGIGVAWQTLENAITSAGRYRLTGQNTYEVQFVTATFCLGNPQASKCTFHCWKPETTNKESINASVDQVFWDFRRENDRLWLDIELEAGEFRTIKITYKADNTKVRRMPLGFIFRAKLRRRLSEFRDDYVRQDSAFARFVSGARRILGR